jgi:hypothetical protein
MSDPNAPQDGLSAAQPPYGQQPGAPYNPTGAPGAPGAPGGGSPYGPPPTGDPYGAPPAGGPYGAPPPPVKKSKAGKIIGIIAGVIVVLLLVCGGISYFALKGTSASNAKVGDCLGGDSISSSGQATSVDVKVVKCTDSAAKYEVVGRTDNVSRAETSSQDTKVCDAFKDATSVVWVGSDEAKGTALCVKDHT